MRYMFASVRGNDFISEGLSPEEAYMNLVSIEKNNGTLWRLHDPYRNKYAVREQGYRPLSGVENDFAGPVYKPLTVAVPA